MRECFDWRLDPPEPPSCNRDDCTYNDQYGGCQLHRPGRDRFGCSDYREACGTCGEPLKDGYCRRCEVNIEDLEGVTA